MILNPVEFLTTLQPWYYIPIALALISLGIALPLHSLMTTYGYRIRHKTSWTVLFGPLAEEVLFRFILLVFLIEIFGVLPAVGAVTIIYSIYMASVYGPQFAADGLVIGALFSLAFLEFGLPIVILAHILYSTIFLVW
ncbi:MAG: CPBP family glutamic-type intramembrane protease [Candidatus Undinarchaeales archaeon]